MREFQQQNGLPVTGAADLATWNAVVDAAREAHIHHGPAEPLRPLFQPAQTISPGEQNMHLYLAQGMLLALRHYYDGMPPVSVTGRHDEACTACLKWLQARCGLPVTGELDRRTWQHMVRLYAQTVGDGPGPIPSGSPTRRVRRRRSASEALRSEAEFLCRKSPKGFSRQTVTAVRSPTVRRSHNPEQVPPCCGGYRHPRPRGAPAQTGILRCAWPKSPE